MARCMRDSLQRLGNDNPHKKITMKTLAVLVAIVSLIVSQLPAPPHGSDLYVAKAPGIGINAPAQQALTRKLGGKASLLATKTDDTGRALLEYLDIAGQLTIDVPCTIRRCRVTAGSAWYGVKNNLFLDFTLEDCELLGPTREDGDAVAAVVLAPHVMRRCVVQGGKDGLKIGRTNGCLIEDCLIYDLNSFNGFHSDGIQIVGSLEGDFDRWVFRRCRIEVKNEAQCCMMLQAKTVLSGTANVSGITIEDCYLSGGGYSLQLRQFAPFTMSKLKVSGCVFSKATWKFGPVICNPTLDLWQNNVVGEVAVNGVYEPVLIKTRQLITPKGVAG
jgi:hypothetical protein